MCGLLCFVKADDGGVHDEVILRMEEDTQAAAAALRTYVESANVFTTPVVCNARAATAMQQTMMGMFEELTAQGGSWSDTTLAYNALVTRAISATIELLPADLDALVTLLDLVQKCGKNDVLSSDGTQAAAKLMRTITAESTLEMADVLFAMRAQVFFHVLTSIGMHQTQVTQGPLIKKRT